MSSPQAFRWIKTECGRAKYVELASRSGVAAKIRLGWFVLIAAARDLSISNQDWSIRFSHRNLNIRQKDGTNNIFF